MRAVDSSVLEAARHVFDYLAATDDAPETPCDAIIGFGMFDLALPRFCGDLFAGGAGRHLIFTGGIGAGTGTLGGREADVWRQELGRAHPEIGDEHVLVENRSTNTTENIVFTRDVLARTRPHLAFGRGLRRAIIVASPSRLRRVRLAMRQLQPEVEVIRQLPPVTFAAQQALYAANHVDFLEHLTGELDRIVAYPARGWIAAEALPADIVAAHDILRRHAATAKAPAARRPCARDPAPPASA